MHGLEQVLVWIKWLARALQRIQGPDWALELIRGLEQTLELIRGLEQALAQTRGGGVTEKLVDQTHRMGPAITGNTDHRGTVSVTTSAEALGMPSAPPHWMSVSDALGLTLRQWAWSS